MKKNLSTIMNALIIFLLIVLVYVMLNYYARGSAKIAESLSKVSTFSEESLEDTSTVKEAISSHKEDTLISNNEKLSENETSIQNPDATIEPFESQEVSASTPTAEPQKRPSLVTTQKEPGSSLIITSDNEISNQEKREILSDLDKALMELLEVVDKVQPVDESRLITDSEVTSP